MAQNFKCQSNFLRDRIHLKLYGDFDGSSAFELINILKNHKNSFHKIFIDTNNLNKIHPFGMDVLKKNFAILDINLSKIIIIGKHRFSLKQIWS